MDSFRILIQTSQKFIPKVAVVSTSALMVDNGESHEWAIT